jgi:hypothetical protein
MRLDARCGNVDAAEECPWIAGMAGATTADCGTQDSLLRKHSENYFD